MAGDRSRGIGTVIRRSVKACGRFRHVSCCICLCSRDKLGSRRLEGRYCGCSDLHALIRACRYDRRLSEPHFVRASACMGESSPSNTKKTGRRSHPRLPGCILKPMSASLRISRHAPWSNGPACVAHRQVSGHGKLLFFNRNRTMVSTDIKGIRLGKCWGHSVALACVGCLGEN